MIVIRVLMKEHLYYDNEQSMNAHAKGHDNGRSINMLIGEGTQLLIGCNIYVQLAEILRPDALLGIICLTMLVTPRD